MYFCPQVLEALFLGVFLHGFFFLSCTHVMVLPPIFILCELYNSCYFVALFFCMFILCPSKSVLYEPKSEAYIGK